MTGHAAEKHRVRMIISNNMEVVRGNELREFLAEKDGKSNGMEVTKNDVLTYEIDKASHPDGDNLVEGGTNDRELLNVLGKTLW